MTRRVLHNVGWGRVGKGRGGCRSETSDSDLQLFRRRLRTSQESGSGDVAAATGQGFCQNCEAADWKSVILSTCLGLDQSQIFGTLSKPRPRCRKTLQRRVCKDWQTAPYIRTINTVQNYHGRSIVKSKLVDNFWISLNISRSRRNLAFALIHWKGCYKAPATTVTYQYLDQLGSRIDIKFMDTDTVEPWWFS
jgi:hypothetical protein